MAIQAIRFNKSNLTARVHHNKFEVVRDVEISGLKFKAGAKRSVFYFEKRISGKTAPAITITLGAFPAVSVEEARQEARRLANLCEFASFPNIACKRASDLTGAVQNCRCSLYS